MTSNKAQKRAIRERMAKTGERYTVARHYLLDQHLMSPNENGVEPGPDAAEMPPRVGDPGVGDEAVRRATGKGWDEWLALLDGWGATERTHAEIARHLAEVHGVDGWWAQSVTVGYERARGMRARHQHADGFSVSASKTVPVPVERLFAAFVDETTRDGWLEPGTLRPRTALPHRSARFDVLTNDTRIEVYFTARGETKASVQIQHSRLPVKDDVEPWRAFWKERLARLAAMLS